MITSIFKDKRFYWASPVVTIYAIICLAVMALVTVMPGSLENGVRAWFHSPAIGYGSWFGVQPYVQLFSHVAGHANWTHLSANFIFLMLLGIQVEQHYGSGKLFMLILVTALLTAVFTMYLTSAVVLGASGVVFLFITLSLFADRDADRVPYEALLVAAFFVAREVYAMFGDDNVSQATHLLGAGVGFIYGMWLQKHPDLK